MIRRAIATMWDRFLTWADHWFFIYPFPDYDRELVRIEYRCEEPECDCAD